MSNFLRALIIRATRSAAQVAVLTIGTGAVGIVEVDWAAVASLSAGAAVLSALTSVATGLPEVEDD